MDMTNKCNSRRRGSREDKPESGSSREERKKLRQQQSSSILMANSDINFMNTLSSRHSTSSPETMHSPQTYTDEIGGRRRSSSRASSSSSPAPLSDHHPNSGNGSNQQHRRSSDALIDSSMSSNCHNNDNGGSFSSAGAIPLTKNVGVSVNFGKPNVKSNSSSSAGVQHILPNGHQHQPQQHMAGTTSIIAASIVNNTNSHNSNNNNSAAINLGHGHIGTIAGPPSVSISSGLGIVGPSSSSNGVNHNSSLSTSPAVNAPTTCTNKGVPSSHNQQQQQQQHLSILSPTTNHPRMSPHSHSPNLPIVNHGLTESLQAGASPSMADPGKNGNSSSSSTSSTSSSSRNGGNGDTKNNSGGIQTGPNSPSASSTTSSSSCSGGSKGETQPNVPKANTNGTDGSNNNTTTTNTNRIVSQNVNGTLAVTGVPSNECELQLFRVLQRANLLSYFDVMIELGGDDVQQLCDAGEEEFLEIMALIGMASKPLHVRRLQKALQEWMTQPNLFQVPVLPPCNLGGGVDGGNSGNPQLQVLPQLVAATTGGGQGLATNLPYHAVPGTTTGLPMIYTGASTCTVIPSISDSKESASLLNQNQSVGTNQLAANNDNMIPSGNPFAEINLPQGNLLNPHFGALLGSLSPNLNNIQHHQRQIRSSHSNNSLKNRITRGKERNSGGIMHPLPVSISDIKIPVDQLIPSHFLETRIRTSSELSSPASSIAGSPHPDGRNSVSPVPLSLQDHEVQKLADAAMNLIRSLPPSVAEPKFSAKRKTSADYELILRLSDSDPRRIMEEVRRVAAVYGRADAKRKSLKPLSMHELAINEAASQLCKHVPALLTKREELLSLSRQVLRESGLPYAAVSSTFSIPILANGFINAASINSLNSINNNNDVNTKSKYEDINRSSSNHHKARESSGEGNSIFNSFHAKRFRLDSSSEIEIQEYNHNRQHSAQERPSSPSGSNNGMQITELRCVPPRRSPSEDILPTPLELVTVTSSDTRKNGIASGRIKSSTSSIDSNSPPIRRPFSTESDDLNNINSSSFHQLHGMRFGHPELNNTHPSVKIASIPVSGGSISILNHSNVNSGSHHFNPYLHSQYNGSIHGSMKFIPVNNVKSEPTVN